MQNMIKNIRILCFKIAVYVKYKCKIFLVLKFLLVASRLVSGQWIYSVVGGRLVGSFKETQGFYNQISKLSENVDRLVTPNKKLSSELLIVRDAKQNL